MTNLVSQIEAWRRGGDDVDAMRNMLAEIDRLRAAFKDCVEYIELDSERPHFLFSAKSLLLEGRSAEPTEQHPQEHSDRLRQIANLIESRPVLGHWPAMMAEADANFLRSLAVAIGEQTTCHTIEEDFQHFLSYAGLRGQNEAVLRQAYYAGAGVISEPRVNPTHQQQPFNMTMHGGKPP